MTLRPEGYRLFSRGVIMKKILTLAVLAAASASFASRAPFISEMYQNPPGGGDNGRESIEVQGPAGMSLTNWYIVVIEGDKATPASTVPGTVDQVITLSGAIGTNGLHLIRDAAGFLNPQPDPGTSIQIFDFTPDIENDSNTYLLGYGVPPTVGTDIDADNDGVADSAKPFPLFTVVDCFGNQEGDLDAIVPELSLVYNKDFGGIYIPAFPDLDGGEFTPDVIYSFLNAAQTGRVGFLTTDVLNGPDNDIVGDPTELGWTSTISAAPSFDLFPRINPGNRNYAYAAPIQTLSVALDLQNLSGTAGVNRPVQWYLERGGTIIQTGGVFGNGVLTASVDISAEVTGDATLVIDGGNFLRKRVAVTLTGNNQSLNVLVLNGDVNNDGIVDGNDVNTILADFGAEGEHLRADVNLDGIIDGNDVNAVLASFGSEDE